MLFRFRRRARAMPVAGALFSWSLVCGCVDPAGTFDDFVARDRERQDGKDAGHGEPDAAPADDGGVPVLPTPAQIDGTYLSVISSALYPTKPVLYILEIKATEAADGLDIMQRDRPLSYEDRRTPVAEFSAYRMLHVSADGKFVDERTGVITPGAANAVAPGIETKADLVFRSSLRDAEFDPETGQVTFFCGTFDGMLIEPYSQSLAGSTFTTIRITDPAHYPEPVINCAKTPAEPLP